MIPLVLALAALAQTVHVENTSKIGRRVENPYYIADLSPRTINGHVEDSGTIRALTFKEFGVTFFRSPPNGRLHKGPSIQRVGARGYVDMGEWDPVQQFREDHRDGAYIHHREGYYPGYPEVKVTAEYRFPPDAPYFLVDTALAVEKPIRVSLLRNNEMTMDLFFTHVVWPGHDPVEFDARAPILAKSPIPVDVPWLAFINPAKGYGYGFVRLGSRQTKSANADTFIADGYVSSTERVVNARYWSRHIVWNAELDLAPGDRFEEQTAYVLFHSSPKSPMGDFFEWEKRIRAAITKR